MKRVMNHWRTDSTLKRGVRALPGTCPSCRSLAIATTAKQPDANSYWRCADRGEVWNQGRTFNESALPR
jgi:hypothetical protein